MLIRFCFVFFKLSLNLPHKWDEQTKRECSKVFYGGLGAREFYLEIVFSDNKVVISKAAPDISL